MHDKYNNPLKVGDEVLIHATVSECHTGTEEYCNITVEAVEPMYPSEDHTTIVLNARQVMKTTKTGPGGLPQPDGETLGPGKSEIAGDDGGGDVLEETQIK
jgi:hypothetical protein